MWSSDSDLMTKIMVNVIAALALLTAIYLLIIGYRFLLNYIGTGKLKPTNVKYAELHTIVNNKSASGEVNFYFTLPETTKIRFVIADANDNVVQELINEEKKEGGHTVSLDSTLLPNEIYFYQLHTDLQKISKVFKIEN